MIAAGLLVIGAASCGRLVIAPVATAAAATPQDPRSVSLAPQDLPDGLGLCVESGRIDSYLQHLQVEGSPAYELTAGQWAALKRGGATAGWVQSYAQTAEDCAARLGERKAPAAISFAIRFKDDASATAGYAGGFLGLRPESGMLIPGLAHGSETQLTSTAWTYDQTDRLPSLFVAYWANRQFDLFLLTERLAPDAARRAASGMNGRVR
jgi:hypothetical protein